jgi:dihydrofolate reductase
VKLAIIAALSRNRVIGKVGNLPWHIPEDLKRFKRLTTGHPVLMGRKTFESLGKPLKERRNVVLSSSPTPGVETFGSIREALDSLADQKLVFVLGGGQVYSQMIEKVDFLYLTIIDREVDGDTFFPPYEHLVGSIFELVKEERHQGFTFVDYARRNSLP